MEPVAESHSVNCEPKSMLVALLRGQGESVPRCGGRVPYVWDLPVTVLERQHGQFAVCCAMLEIRFYSKCRK